MLKKYLEEELNNCIGCPTADEKFIRVALKKAFERFGADFNYDPKIFDFLLHSTRASITYNNLIGSWLYEIKIKRSRKDNKYYYKSFEVSDLMYGDDIHDAIKRCAKEVAEIEAWREKIHKHFRWI